MKPELLAPAGSLKKLHTALRFGADAVYFGGKDFSLRAYAGNLDDNEIAEAVSLAHAAGKKAYVTLNIFAHNADFPKIKDYAEALVKARADAVIVSDIGVVYFLKKHFPKLNIHLSTQANTTNKYAAEKWANEGVTRIVLARELNLTQIREIADHLNGRVELEAFVHGAMCISYSGRCLLSNYLTGRDGNRGECIQPCRWAFNANAASENSLELYEDKRGSYILNSKDLNTSEILDKIIDAGVTSMKIEGRMKSEYYIASVVKAYRTALDKTAPIGEVRAELNKVSHREYTTGFYLGEAQQCYETSKADGGSIFIAEVEGYDEDKKAIEVTMRNRFFEGDELEILSPSKSGTIKCKEIFDEDGRRVTDCKLVQQKLFIKSDIRLERYDILRKGVL